MSLLDVSYRRDDTGRVTGRLSDRLIDRYGADSIFIDIDSIPAGVGFRHHIHTVLDGRTPGDKRNEWLGPPRTFSPLANFADKRR